MLQQKWLGSIGLCFSLWIIFNVTKWRTKNKLVTKRFNNPFDDQI
jgi:hypothetical protein